MESDIKEFYSNKNVLITGATGLFGKVLIQKLIREIEDIGSLFLMIRPKESKTVDERKDEIFNDVVFDKMKEKVPQFFNKIEFINGDVSKKNLGLTDKDRNIIKENIHVVFHCAASMNMDEKLKLAVETNVRGLQELIQLSQEMTNLKSILIVSTAYSNCIYQVIEEKFYETPIEPEALIKFAEGASENILDNITTSLIGNWGNVYCFTKAVAEDLLYKNGKNLPIGMFRPSIVMPMYEDPYPGWTSNVYGPVGVMMGAGMGILRVFLTSTLLQCDLVPVDYCINALICAALETSKQKYKENASPMPIFNYAGGVKRNISWKQLKEFSKEYKYPLKDALWPTIILHIKNKYAFYILWFILHTIPGCLIDSFLILSRKKPKMLKTYKKIWKFCNVLSFFSTREWNIINENVNALWQNLKTADKALFPFDMDKVNYKKLILDTCTGLKIYILKEGLHNVKYERNRYKRLLFIHKTLMYMLQLGAAFILYVIIKKLFMQ
ncbi:hypothetical protein FQA39_LY14994 [Lamprigera yunnana]|nr:hypothetical protein FQA39_LY14994 [Lamprigera yunnana]